MSERQWKRLDEWGGGGGDAEQRGGGGGGGAIGAAAAASAAAGGRIGARGVVHGNTGRAPKHRLSAEHGRESWSCGWSSTGFQRPALHREAG